MRVIKRGYLELHPLTSQASMHVLLQITDFLVGKTCQTLVPGLKLVIKILVLTAGQKIRSY